MKIFEQTPNRLKLQADNLMTAMVTVLFGSVFVVAGLAAMVFLGELATLTCQRWEKTYCDG